MNSDSRKYLRELAKEVLGDGRRVLVTGGTGFVGSVLAQVLCEAGHDVSILGRSRFRVRSEGTFIQGDIAELQDVEDACEHQEIVFHTAALTSPWGSLDLHRKTNTQGTANVIEACKKHDVQRLVHVSSTAIHFEYKDLYVEDDSPLPQEFSCAYARTKAEAESLVQSAIASGMNAYIVRARAVFGPGDSALLPRLIAAAQLGRLRQIGAGNNLCDLTYVDNLVAGLLLAARPDGPTGLCTITNQEPVNLWQLLNRVLKRAVSDYRANRKVAYSTAFRLAHFLEFKHRLLRLRGEPLLTRYTVGLLGWQQIYRSSASEKELAYKPHVSMDVAVRQTVNAITERPKVLPGAQSVNMRLFSTGYIEARRFVAERGATREKIRIHASIALIEHPTQGPILFDCGYSPAFLKATQKLPYRFYRWATKVNTRPEWSPVKWVERCGYGADEIRLVLISHFHGDHLCGLNEFPNAEFVTLDRTWGEARDRKGFAALKRAILPDLIPENFCDRVHTIKDMNGPGVGPFLSSHDLFRDGSIRLFDLSGHAAGQMGALLNCVHGELNFLVADAFWTTPEISRRLKPTLAYRLVADDYRAALSTRDRLFEVRDEHPDIQLISTHCPDIAARQGFDRQLASALAESSGDR